MSMNIGSIKIMTCNSAYENGKLVGGYHEIHEVKYLQNIKHIFATIDSIIENNLLYGCIGGTILEEVQVCCDNKNITNKIEKHYKEYKVPVIISCIFN